MSFADALAETRERFSEALQLLNLLDASEQDRKGPASITDKALKGLALVSIYAAVERSINFAVEQALFEISSHGTPSSDCNDVVLTIFHYSKIQALKDCGGEQILPKAANLIFHARSGVPLSTNVNPFSYYLQNVGANTIVDIAARFGVVGYSISPASSTRLDNLRERRNAISHGREAASAAGERFTMRELRSLFVIADTEVTRFVDALKVYCEKKHYRLARV